MDVMHSCRCCLQRVADKVLTTPYTHLGKTEIYADMLKECFGLHLWVTNSLLSGICSECVGRLRDASDFKLQVQRSQVELLERLKGSRVDQDEDSPKQKETAEDDGSEDDMLLLVEKSEGVGAKKWAHSSRLERLPRDATRRSAATHPYQCHDCGQMFKDKKAISRHIQYNCPTGALTAYNKKYRKMKLMNCSYCSYRSKNKRNLFHHEMKHIGEKPYQCTHCEYKTGRKADFERHQSIHLGKKPFKCNFCNYSCIQKHTLLTHKRIHTGEKPYECNHCGDMFSRVQCLRKHVKHHKRETFEISPIRVAI